MSRFTLASDPSKFRDNIVTGEAGRFVDDDQTMQASGIASSSHESVARDRRRWMLDQFSDAIEEFPFGRCSAR